MCRRPVEQFDLYAIDAEGLFVPRDELRGEAIGRRGSARTGGERGFLFLLVVLMSDDREAGGKGDQAIDVISVAVGENHRGHLVLASMTITPFRPTMTPLFPPPPSTTYTSVPRGRVTNGAGAGGLRRG